MPTVAIIVNGCGLNSLNNQIACCKPLHDWSAMDFIALCDMLSQGTRQCALVIKVGVAYVNICILRCLKQELACDTDK